MASDSLPRVWFITGTSTGLGRELAELILEKGEIVVATARTPSTLDALSSKYPTSRLLVKKLDITNQQQIIEAFSKAKEVFGRLDVIVNNAGFGGSFGEFEILDEGQSRDVFETNVWGTLKVTKEAIRFLRDENPSGAGGRLWQMSSYAGLVGWPGLSMYSASKFAIEGMTESLAEELDPSWNIKITIFEPGWIYSEAAKKAKWSAPHPAYQSPNLATVRQRNEGFGVEFKDTRRSVEVFYRFADIQDPPLHLAVGKDAIVATRKKYTEMMAAVDRFETWSEGLEA